MCAISACGCRQLAKELKLDATGNSSTTKNKRKLSGKSAKGVKHPKKNKGKGKAGKGKSSKGDHSESATAAPAAPSTKKRTRGKAA